ncbi:hypothetical protein I3843_10G019200 [Carya illinoinensis]|uniref:Glutaredoxin domain-containing protein n=1 Tax=Carya illinoinensis TaxID=32201 RepID=A0A922DUF3_CARIL|nr:hypothetical protein I3842_10G019200 [Carya illinoinensis]KAG7958389.1 hypothetical protein I3843_10G019200 [Carya illinoinensis]KAG7958390.1 hypothetical protein I3843_10G019200 [Carya illinoinensis]
MSSLSCPLIPSLVILTQTLHALYSEFWTRVEAMKGTRGKFFMKLKFIPSFSTLKQGLGPQLDPSEKVSSQNCQIPPVYKERDGKSNNLLELLVGSTGVSELDNHPQDEEMELDVSFSDKDCFTSSIKTKDKVLAKETPEIPILSRSIMEHGGTHEVKDFEEICPPGGSDSIVFYTTSLRGIRKTFEDCSTIRFLLESFKVLFYERDVSMHLEYREELWNIMGSRVIPPRIFIKGRYIGGADEVVSLHEQGKLSKLLEVIPLDPSSSSCSGCANVRFVVCPNCNGSRKIIADGESDDLFIRCPECNENGLVKCPTCS